MLQTICHLLIRPKCFRLERQFAGRGFHPLNSCALQGTHNNLVENAIRPFAVGRKSWLFAATPGGARASANLYSLVETAKLNGLNEYAYLKYVFTHLPAAKDADDIDALLPWNVTPEQLAPMLQAPALSTT